LRLFAAQPPDLVILDVLMPPPDGLEVCRRIRAADARVPVLMLTARDTTLDEVRALDVGADRYLTKPFDHLKLMAHLRALARRAEAAQQSPPLQLAPDLATGDLEIDLAARAVRRDGQLIDLSPTEWVLLEVLARHPGQIVPHHTLLERVWGGGRGGVNDLKTYINRLRRKLGDDIAHPRYIETRRNQGYRLARR
jgi:DNA-binding response OmpR family regulator